MNRYSSQFEHFSGTFVVSFMTFGFKG